MAAVKDEEEKESERETLLKTGVLTARHSLKLRWRWHQETTLATLFCMAVSGSYTTFHHDPLEDFGGSS